MDSKRLEDDDRKVVLFLCASNSCRSQIAEYYLNHLKSDDYVAFSAGTDIDKEVDERCLAVMSEDSINLAGKRTKNVDRFKDVNIDIVVTLCGRADASCPTFSGAGVKYHRRFDNPAREAKKVADNGGNHEDILNVYRRIRDEIKQFIVKFPKSLETPNR